MPELGLVVLDSGGAPGGAQFTHDLHALYPVSYGAHFAVRRARGEALYLMALER